jgi:hypothetical protein
MIPNTSCEYSSWKPFCRRETSRMASREPLAVRICCLPFPRKSPEIASCVAVGCFTVKAYRDMEEKLVMMGDGGRWPWYYCRVDVLRAREWMSRLNDEHSEVTC